MDAISPDHCDTTSLAEWLVDGARSAPEPHQVLAQACGRLLDCGLPLWRVAVFVRTLHPNIPGRAFVWRPGEAVQVRPANFGLFESEEFRNTCGKYFFGYPKKPGASPLADQCIKVRTVP